MISAIVDIVIIIKSFSVLLKRRSFGKLSMLICASLFTAVLSAQTGPGGVGNSASNLLWMKGDAGTSTVINGNPVVSWLDQSGNMMNATQVTVNRQPKFVANAINGRPSVLLNNAADGVYDYFNLPPGFSDFTNGLSAFVVIKPNTTVAWSNFFNLGGGVPDLFDDAISFSRDNLTTNFFYQVVSNSVDSYISRPIITNASYQIFSVRQSPGVPPGTSTARLYKNNVLSGLPFNTNSGADRASARRAARAGQ